MFSSVRIVLSALTTAHLLFIYVTSDSKENPSNPKRKCFQCNMAYECNLGLCYGDYCIKSLASDQYVSKGCENKTFRLEDGESYMQERSEFMERSHCTTEYMFGIPNIVCYCSDADFCNRSLKPRSTFAVVILFLLVLIETNFIS